LRIYVLLHRKKLLAIFQMLYKAVGLYNVWKTANSKTAKLNFMNCKLGLYSVAFVILPIAGFECIS